MPDQDILTDAFAGFTASATTEITSPGAGAARRTVRRRRIAAGTVVAIAVLAAVGYAVLPRGSAPAQPANPLPERPGTIWSDTGRLTGTPAYSDDLRSHAAGWYQVRFVCTGGGLASVDFGTANGEGAPIGTMPCDGTERGITTEIHTDIANIWVRVAPFHQVPAVNGIWALRIDYSLTGFPPD